MQLSPWCLHLQDYLSEDWPTYSHSTLPDFREVCGYRGKFQGLFFFVLQSWTFPITLLMQAYVFTFLMTD